MFNSRCQTYNVYMSFDRLHMDMNLQTQRQRHVSLHVAFTAHMSFEMHCNIIPSKVNEDAHAHDTRHMSRVSEKFCFAHPLLVLLLPISNSIAMESFAVFPSAASSTCGTYLVGFRLNDNDTCRCRCSTHDLCNLIGAAGIPRYRQTTMLNSRCQTNNVYMSADRLHMDMSLQAQRQ